MGDRMTDQEKLKILVEGMKEIAKHYDNLIVDGDDVVEEIKELLGRVEAGIAP